MGLTRPDKGSVRLEGVDVTHLSVDKRARMGIGYLSQEPSIFRQLTAAQNILCVLETLPLTPQARRERLKELLGELHLTAHADRRAHTLSGGERRRLEIARTLVTSPRVLLFDEPFANVDPITIHEVKLLISHLRSKGICILITDHNARELSSVIDRCYLCQSGSVTHQGTMEELLADATARSSYFGKDFCI